MKVSAVALTAATAATAVSAQPHLHNHQHLHAHFKRTVTETSWASGPTAYVLILDGKEISIDEACKGVHDNSLKWADEGGNAAALCASKAQPTPAPVATTSVAPSSSTEWAQWTSTGNAAGQFYEKPSSSSEEAPASASSSSSSQWHEWGAGLDSEFPDGEVDCGQFPTEYGPISLAYLGMGGWSGLQKVTMGDSAVTDIVTGISGDDCTDGMMCSYACPPGYQKSQWPTAQGSTGQSVGGLQCKNGKLHLTNPNLSKKLCIPGMGNVQAKNSANAVVAVCRTDYPGTESETVPVELQPGQSEELAVPDAGSYYNWQGKSTSAQYYLNPIGTSAQEGCQWGKPGGNIGNYAPINFGVGYKDGKTWLSIFQNAPTTTSLYEGSVELQGDLSAKCKYENGQYCGATGCNSNGCTVSVNSGTATFVVSN